MSMQTYNPCTYIPIIHQTVEQHHQLLPHDPRFPHYAYTFAIHDFVVENTRQQKMTFCSNLFIFLFTLTNTIFLSVCIFRKVALLAVFSANKYYKIHSYIFRNKNMSLSFYLSFSPQRVPNIAQLNFPAMNTIRYKIQSKTQKADSKNKSQHTNNNNKNSIVQTND